MAELRVLPKPLARRPDPIDNLSYLREFGQTVEDTRLRTELLASVSGLCSLTMSQNVNINGGGSSATPLPFDRNVIPYKNASPFKGLFTPSSKERCGILIEAEGTWRADTQVTFSGGTGETNAELYLSAWNLTTRTLIEERKFFARLYQQPRSWTVQHTILVPPELAGQVVVCCSVAHGGFYWPVRGGLTNSSLSVNRWDIRTDASGGNGSVGEGGDYD